MSEAAESTPAGPAPIPFTQPWTSGLELEYLTELFRRGDFSSDGRWSQACGELLERRLGIHRVLLTPSCTAALELAAQLCALEEGDEVILPSFTFVSTASAFVREGARPVFVDVREEDLNIDPEQVAEALTPRTRAIVPVHYAGVGCDMDALGSLSQREGLLLIEDAAQAVGASYRGRMLGSIGSLATFSFHQTKNFVCGEGGALCVNDPALLERAEILREKGTNRKQFFRGDVDKYTWVDLGGSQLLSEPLAAMLLAQLESMDRITQMRRVIVDAYDRGLEGLESSGFLRRPRVPEGRQSNHHLYHVLLPDEDLRDRLLADLRAQGIGATFHYVPLHSSPMGRRLAPDTPPLPVTEELSGRLLRLPLYPSMGEAEISRVLEAVHRFAAVSGT